MLLIQQIIARLNRETKKYNYNAANYHKNYFKAIKQHDFYQKVFELFLKKIKEYFKYLQFLLLLFLPFLSSLYH